MKTGSSLAAETYTLTLRSAADGFKDVDGVQLDGNQDGAAGCNYVQTFNVTASGALLSIPDIARGPGQPVDQPASGQRAAGDPQQRGRNDQGQFHPRV